MRGRTSLLVLSALGLACTKANPAFQDETGTTGDPGSTGPAVTTTGATTADLSSGPDTPTTGADASSETSAAITGSTTGESTGDDTTTGTTGSTTETVDAPASCAEVRDLGMTQSGVYTLAVPEQAGATIDVWCEQQLAGGGWLLVGRSVAADASPEFGWSRATGDVLDDSAAYSLNLVAHQFPATELLIGSYTQGKTLAGAAYKLTAPAGFPAAFGISVGQTSGSEVVLGGCLMQGGPTMLRWIGYTSLGDRFRLRNVAEMDAGDVFGLFPNGFHFGIDNCADAGKLQNEQGVIFVR